MDKDGDWTDDVVMAVKWAQLEFNYNRLLKKFFLISRFV